MTRPTRITLRDPQSLGNQISWMLRTPPDFPGGEVVPAAEYDALAAELERAKARSCAVCNDTGHLDDAQAWDCGEPNSECPYCPGRVQRLLADHGALAASHERLRQVCQAVADAAPVAGTEERFGELVTNLLDQIRAALAQAPKVPT